MILDLFSTVMGKLSNRWLIGRRLVLDLTSAKERRVSVLELPRTDVFHFDLRDVSDGCQIVLSANGHETVIGTFESLEAAKEMATSIRAAMVRPLRRLVLGALGVIIVVFAFDVATANKASRVPTQAVQNQQFGGAGQGLTPEMAALLKSRLSPDAKSAAKGAAPQSAVGTPSVASPDPADLGKSSPEAQAAIDLLKGR